MDQLHSNTDDTSRKRGSHLTLDQRGAIQILNRQGIMGPLSRPLPKILRVPSDRTVLSSEAPKVELIRNLIA